MALLSSSLWAQAVCLPAPRLLTTFPMGGEVGSTVEVSITGDNIEDVDLLSFSHPGITAIPKVNDKGIPVPNTFVVSIKKDCPVGIHEARVMTRLGVSSSRVFNVGSLSEISQVKPNTTLDKAMPLAVDSICNASMTQKAIDFYSFEAQQGQRIVVDCAAKGIDSKLNPVLIVADAKGNDLLVERRGGALDFEVPADGKYIIKVHDLTFNGGSAYFYRLALKAISKDEAIVRLPSTKTVSSFSWPPEGLAENAAASETEPNNDHAQPQKITLPCDISGSFFPAADVDTFEFAAKKGDVWWVEVASERLGLPTDPSIVVQKVTGEGKDETLTDVVELTDISSPIKVSSNGYSYDGPPYNPGSADILGKVEIKEDGNYRLQLTDLFGGTRNDPRNIYRLIIRKAQPDFALVGWALHMNLRNGDRNALSKPIALRGGATIPLEIVAVRRDGFNGDINLTMSGLPEGVTATGLKIPAGKSKGIMLVTAKANAPRGLSSATLTGTADINGTPVTRPCFMASMAWPVPNAWSEIPNPRLLVDVPVSVSNSEQAPITISAKEQKVLEVAEGEKLTIPLVQTLRSDFSGTKMSLKTYGEGFERTPAFDVPLNEETSQAVLDLGKLKTPPGDYTIAFYGSAVAKYRYNPEAVTIAEATLQRLQEESTAIAAELKTLTESAKTATEADQATVKESVQAVTEKQKANAAALKVAQQQLKSATAKAKPKDIVDIVVSTPITIRVNPAEKK
ncbi:PPC domain-containing protein [Thalassoglobus polymorphus]|nr:PPC domain-containing protein [Thalassoglobus polymorphus]